jgi:hypothetical protein
MTAETLAVPNPAAFTVSVPRETTEAPGTFRVRRNVSPLWSCCMAFGFALMTVNSAFEFTPVWKTPGATA